MADDDERRREEFESAMTDLFGAFLAARDCNGCYVDDLNETRWQGWQAARGARPAAAPSTADVAAELSADRNWLAGLNAGFRLGLVNDNAGLERLQKQRRREMREFLAAPSTVDAREELMRLADDYALELESSSMSTNAEDTRNRILKARAALRVAIEQRFHCDPAVDCRWNCCGGLAGKPK